MIMIDETNVMPQKLSFSIQEFSRCSSLGRSKLYLAIKNGDLKARKFGKRTIIEYQDGIDFIRRLPEMKSK